MNLRMICKVLGFIISVEGGCMMIPAIVSLLYWEHDAMSFFTSGVLCCMLGLALSCVPLGAKDRLKLREGFVAVSLGWAVLSVLGALPYLMSGCFVSPVDALFESFSGFTTTGATLIADLEAMPKSILFWRSFTQWLGGMGVLVLTLALLPKLGAGSIFLLQAESPGAIKYKLVPRLGDSAKILYCI